MVPIWLAEPSRASYFGTVILLIGVELFRAVGMGAQALDEPGRSACNHQS